MADGQIVIDTRINNKRAYSDLKDLTAAARTTAKEIDDASTADHAAAAWSKNIEKIRARLRALEKEYTKADDTARRIAAETEKQNPNDYTAAEKSLKRDRDYNASQRAAENAYKNIQKTREALRIAVEDMAQKQAAAEQKAVQQQAATEQKAVAQAAAAAKSNTFAGVKKAALSAFGVAQKGVEQFRARLSAAGRSITRFARRITSIAASALVFNALSSALRKATSYMSNAVMSSASLQAALANLRGAAMTAAAPILQAVIPALTALANAAATVFSYLSRLAAMFTGTTVSAAKTAAKSMGSAASAASSAAKEAKRSLAGFDEIERLNDNDSDGGGGGSSSGVTPNFDFEGGESPFLQSILDAIEKGDWYAVGERIAEKLRDSLNAIDWDGIQSKVAGWANNLAQVINGFSATAGVFEALGATIAQGLNTITLAFDTFFQTVQWTVIGAGLANGLQTMMDTIDWERLGRFLTDGFRAVLEMLHGFVLTFSGWADLGRDIADMAAAALNNMDWVQAISDLSTLAIGILTAINTALAAIDWATVGQTVINMLLAVDWGGLLLQLLDLVFNLLPVLILPLIASFILSTVLPAVLSGLAALITSVITAIGAWPVLLIAVLIVVFAKIYQSLTAHWDEITTGLATWFSGVKQAWSSLWSAVRDITSESWSIISTELTAALTVFLSTWGQAWQAAKDTVSSIWSGIVSIIRGCVNSMIGVINGMISGIVSGLNSVIGALNSLSFDVPDWVPSIGGRTFGFSIGSISAPQIPYLAQGAVIPANREFLAVLGDQSSGTNIEAPADLIRQIVAEQMADVQGGQMAGFEAVCAVLREILDAVYGIELTDEQVGRAAQRWQRQKNIVAGGSYG